MSLRNLRLKGRGGEPRIQHGIDQIRNDISHGDHKGGEEDCALKQRHIPCLDRGESKLPERVSLATLPALFQPSATAGSIIEIRLPS